MDDYRYQQFEDDDDGIGIDLGEVLRKLSREWRFIAKCSIMGGVVGLLVAFSIPRRYKAESVMAPERARSSVGGNLSSLASLAGINLSNISPSNAMTPDLYPTIIYSTPFLVDLFSTPVEIEAGEGSITTDVYTYLREYAGASWLAYAIKAPFEVVEWFAGLFKGDVEPVGGHACVDSFRLTEEQAEIAEALTRSISVDVDRKTYMIRVTVHTQDPTVSASLCRAVSDKLKDYMDEYHQRKAMADLSYYEKLCGESRSEYYIAQQKYADYMDANQGIVHRSRHIEQERLQNEMNLKYDLYNTCAQQVQQAKARIQLETPEFAVISPATVPLKSARPSKRVIFACFIFLGAVGATAWVLAGDRIKGLFQPEVEKI